MDEDEDEIFFGPVTEKEKERIKGLADNSEECSSTHFSNQISSQSESSNYDNDIESIPTQSEVSNIYDSDIEDIPTGNCFEQNVEESSSTELSSISDRNKSYYDPESSVSSDLILRTNSNSLFHSLESELTAVSSVDSVFEPVSEKKISNGTLSNSSTSVESSESHQITAEGLHFSQPSVDSGFVKHSSTKNNDSFPSFNAYLTAKSVIATSSDEPEIENSVFESESISLGLCKSFPKYLTNEQSSVKELDDIKTVPHLEVLSHKVQVYEKLDTTIPACDQTVKENGWKDIFSTSEDILTEELPTMSETILMADRKSSLFKADRKSSLFKALDLPSPNDFGRKRKSLFESSLDCLDLNTNADSFVSCKEEDVEEPNKENSENVLKDLLTYSILEKKIAKIPKLQFLSDVKQNTKKICEINRNPTFQSLSKKDKLTVTPLKNPAKSPLKYISPYTMKKAAQQSSSVKSTKNIKAEFRAPTPLSENNKEYLAPARIKTPVLSLKSKWNVASPVAQYIRELPPPPLIKSVRTVPRSPEILEKDKSIMFPDEECKTPSNFDNETSIHPVLPAAHYVPSSNKMEIDILKGGICSFKRIKPGRFFATPYIPKVVKHKGAQKVLKDSQHIETDRGSLLMAEPEYDITILEKGECAHSYGLTPLKKKL